VRRGTRVTSRWHTAGDWRTQAADGSCTVQALMVALRIAHDEVTGDGAFFERRLGERCPIEYGVVCAEALRLFPRPENRNVVFRVPETATEAATEAAHIAYGVVRCDGSVACRCLVVAGSAAGSVAGSVAGSEGRAGAHARDAVRAAELALQRAAEHKRGALHASFRAEDCGALWREVSAAARRAGYTVTRRAASKVYRPADVMV
jgi:hypothetical protein